MADTLDRLGDRLPVYDRGRTKLHCHAKAVLQHFPQDLRLDLAHDLGCDLAGTFLHGDMQHRLFLLQKPQIAQRSRAVDTLLQKDCAGKYRLQDPVFQRFLKTKAFSCPGILKPRDRTDTACGYLLRRHKAAARQDTDLVRLSLARCSSASARILSLCLPVTAAGILLPPGDQTLDLQTAARDLHMGQPDAGIISGDLKHTGTKGIPVLRDPHIAADPVDQALYAFIFQGRA